MLGVSKLFLGTLLFIYLSETTKDRNQVKVKSIWKTELKHGKSQRDSELLTFPYSVSLPARLQSPNSLDKRSPFSHHTSQDSI